MAPNRMGTKEIERIRSSFVKHASQAYRESIAAAEEETLGGDGHQYRSLPIRLSLQPIQIRISGQAPTTLAMFLRYDGSRDSVFVNIHHYLSGAVNTLAFQLYDIMNAINNYKLHRLLDDFCTQAVRTQCVEEFLLAVAPPGARNRAHASLFTLPAPNQVPIVSLYPIEQAPAHYVVTSIMGYGDFTSFQRILVNAEAMRLVSCPNSRNGGVLNLYALLVGLKISTQPRGSRYSSKAAIAKTLTEITNVDAPTLIDTFFQAAYYEKDFFGMIPRPSERAYQKVLEVKEKKSRRSTPKIPAGGAESVSERK